MKMQYRLGLTQMAALGLMAGVAFGDSIDFQLLTWNDAQSTDQLPSAVGLKPSAPMPAQGDWLMFTGDDEQLGAAFNPLGALSHSFADPGGVGGPGFNMAPSLTGMMTLDFASSGGTMWDTLATSMQYTGQANGFAQMNQLLVTPGSDGANDPIYNVDGLPNAGSWDASTAGNWAFSQALDFYLATNIDGDGSIFDIDATFNDALQSGYIIPVSELTSAGMAAVALDDPEGWFSGDFEQYLLDEIATRLPSDATYLLITQMAKSNPVYAEAGLPITLDSLVGNTTFAFTTQIIPAPSAVALFGLSAALVGVRRRQRGA